MRFSEVAKETVNFFISVCGNGEARPSMSGFSSNIILVPAGGTKICRENLSFFNLIKITEQGYVTVRYLSEYICVEKSFRIKDEQKLKARPSCQTHPPPPHGNRAPCNISSRNTTQRETLKNNYPNIDVFLCDLKI